MTFLAHSSADVDLLRVRIVVSLWKEFVTFRDGTAQRWEYQSPGDEHERKELPEGQRVP
jgi:hypothetical protein